MAAGFSKRMGRPKMILPWGDTTVIGAIVEKLNKTNITPIVVVIGAVHEQVQEVLKDLPVHQVFNSRFEENSMVISLQTGLAFLSQKIEAVFVVLGDQPLLPVEVIQLLLDAHCRTHAALIVPSYNMRRGHPWLVDRSLWDEVMKLSPTQTLRDFLNAQSEQIHYVPVDTDLIFQDLDTPADYARLRPT